MEEANAFLEKWMESNADDSIESPVKRLDNALGMYFANMRRHDYFDSKGRGKFMRHFQERGCSPDDLDDELGDFSNPAACTYLQFPMFHDFPLANGITSNPAVRKQQIHEVLQHCYKFGIPPDPNQNSNPMMGMNIYDDDTSSEELDDETDELTIQQLKNENTMLWEKVESMNAKIDELQLEIAMMRHKVKTSTHTAQQYANQELTEYSYIHWDCEHVIQWIYGLNDRKYERKYSMLSEKIKEENILGKHLGLLNRDDLHRLSIMDYEDKIDILNEISNLSNVCV